MVIRRLIAPSVITLVMLGLWLDYLFFRESPWSATNFLAKVLAISIRIFAPLFDPALYWWLGEVIVPVVMIPCGIILLYVSVAKAKVAMSKATPAADEFVPLPSPKPAPGPEVERMTASAAPKAAGRPWKLGLVGKLAASFGALSLLFGVAVSVIVYTRLAGALEKEVKRRVTVFVASLTDAAARYATTQVQPDLRNAVDKYASSKSVAYVYVEDGEGRIVAHMPRELPILLRRDFPKSGERALKGVEVEYRGSPVYEMAARVGERNGGYVHLAIWRDAFEDETRRVVTPIAASILVLLAGVTVVFAWVVWILCLPFIKLVDHASRISRGELELVIGITETDEVGDLVRSFDRMRSSLHAVLTRLEDPESMERTNENG